MEEGITKQLARTSLDVAVHDHIVQHILGNGLKAGDPLPSEKQLADDLGVGRSSIREAVKKLQSLGIVEVKHGTGLFVRESNFDPLREMVGYVIRFSPRALEELGKVRFLLERAAIEEVVPLIGQADIASLGEILQRWSQVAESGGPWDHFDNEFHRVLYGPLGNTMLTMLLEEFWAAFEQLDDPILHEIRPADEVIGDHRAILEAVRAGDPALARLRLTKHFEHLQNCIVLMREGKDRP